MFFYVIDSNYYGNQWCVFLFHYYAIHTTYKLIRHIYENILPYEADDQTAISLSQQYNRLQNVLYQTGSLLFLGFLFPFLLLFYYHKQRI